MFPTRISTRRFFAAAAAASCVLVGIAEVSSASGMPGLTIFSGVRSENQLPWRQDFGGNSGGWDRYRLRIPSKKMDLAVSQFVIDYPDYFDGKFDPEKIEVRVKGKALPLDEVNWDQENHFISIYMAEPVPAGSRVEIVLSNVKNPMFGGTFYFNCEVLSPGDVPLRRYKGTWIVDVG